MDARERRRRAALVVAGVASVVVAVILAGIVVGGLCAVRAEVRAATVAEAPDPAHVAGTVVGTPGRTTDVASALKGIVAKLVGLGLLAAAGGALTAWALMMSGTGTRREHGEDNGR